MANPTYFLDDSAVASRASEVPAASFLNGANAAASNASGIGINADGGEVAGTLSQFTLLSQEGLARTPQISQVIGGEGFTDPAVYPSSGGTEGFEPRDSLRIGSVSVSGDGVMTGIGNAHLADLATGWVAV